MVIKSFLLKLYPKLVKLLSAPRWLLGGIFPGPGFSTRAVAPPHVSVFAYAIPDRCLQPFGVQMNKLPEREKSALFFCFHHRLPELHVAQDPAKFSLTVCPPFARGMM